MAEQRLKGKVAIVTGASRGLGRYVAVKYGAEGATVIVAARSESDNERLPGTIYATADEVTQAGGVGIPIVCNVADQDSITAMVETALEKAGHVDILMNNAGILPPGGVLDIQPKHWDLEVRINLTGTLMTSRAVLPALREQGFGSIINISSVAADRGRGHYGVLKRAIESLTYAMSVELEGTGIAVNALKPVGAIETPGIHMGMRGDNIHDLPPADRYVEAAVLLALKGPEETNGAAYNDAQVVERWADEPLRSQLLALPMR